jgi:hypothetical protein
VYESLSFEIQILNPSAIFVPGEKAVSSYAKRGVNWPLRDYFYE